MARVAALAENGVLIRGTVHSWIATDSPEVSMTTADLEVDNEQDTGIRCKLSQLGIRHLGGGGLVCRQG